MADLFAGTLPIPLSDQIDEIQRELDQRARVYPRMIQDGRLKPERADIQIARMRAVLGTLKGIKNG